MSILLKQRRVVGTFLLLLLLCSVCVVPAMAGSQAELVEDGVHLIKSDASPTVLNPFYYKNMLVTTDFVVDGDQYYWVRIGSEKAEKLSSNDIAKYLCYGGFVVATAAVGMYAGGRLQQ